MTREGGFSNANHLQTLNEKQRDGKEAWYIAYKYRLKGLVSNLKGTVKPLLLCAKSTGIWLTVRGTTVPGTVLSATEFLDFLCARL